MDYNETLYEHYSITDDPHLYILELPNINIIILTAVLPT
jgi:hypothetical protein